MCIYILGINHFDPLGPSTVKRYLKRYIEREVDFGYICTEWDDNTAHTLISSRQHFKDFITQNNKIGLSINTINLIVDSLAYEADVFIEDYPSTDIIWLDEGKSYKTLESYFKFRLDVITQQTMRQHFDINSIAALSRNLWELSLEEEDIGSSIRMRDKHLFNGIEKSMQRCDHNILVLIGARHAQVDREDSTAQLLLKAGYNVESNILSPLHAP